jgi:hypothetical protein
MEVGLSFDVAAVLCFAMDFKDRLGRCNNREGIGCSNVDRSINDCVLLCVEFWQYLKQWGQAVFAARVPFDQNVERLLIDEARQLLSHTKQLAAYGRTRDAQGSKPQKLDALHYYLADFDYLLENWVSPQRSVGPAPRVTVPEAMKQEILRNLATLPPLPNE